MAISSGTFSVGPGKTYTNLTAAFADVAGGGLTADLTFQLYGTITDASGFSTGSGGTWWLNGNTLTIEGMEDNNGDLNTGTKVIIGAHSDFNSGSNFNSTINIRNIRFESADAARYVIIFGATGNNILIDQYFYKCTFNKITLWVGETGNASIGFHLFSRLKFFDGSFFVRSWPAFTVENVSIDGNNSLAYGFDGSHYTFNPTYTLRNVVAINCSTADFSNGSPGTTNAYNCASSDNTVNTAGWDASSGLIGNITPANEFISLSTASSDYLKLEITGSLANGGITPAYISSDIADVPIPDYEGWYPIGCHAANTEAGPEIDFTEFIIDSGALYKDYGLATEQLIGATKGGNKFIIDQNIQDIGYDGRGANVKGSKRILKIQPFIEANVIEVSIDFLQTALPASQVEALATQDQVTRALQLALSDYADNITVVGEMFGKTYPIICMIKNALCISGFNMEMTDKSESVISLKFAGHYDPDDLDTDPWEIRHPHS